MDKILHDQPALMQAYEVQKFAAKVGFDWDDINDVIQKVKEELSEMEEALQRGIRNRQPWNLVIFFLLWLIWPAFSSTNPEVALLNSIIKFKNRFQYMEKAIRK